MVQLHPLAHAQFVGKTHRSETEFEKGALDRNSLTGPFLSAKGVACRSDFSSVAE